MSRFFRRIPVQVLTRRMPQALSFVSGEEQDSGSSYFSAAAAESFTSESFLKGDGVEVASAIVDDERAISGGEVAADGKCEPGLVMVGGQRYWVAKEFDSGTAAATALGLVYNSKAGAALPLIIT